MTRVEFRHAIDSANSASDLDRLGAIGYTDPCAVTDFPWSDFFLGHNFFEGILEALSLYVPGTRVCLILKFHFFSFFSCGHDARRISARDIRRELVLNHLVIDAKGEIVVSDRTFWTARADALCHIDPALQFRLCFKFDCVSKFVVDVSDFHLASPFWSA
jgi:hypothetical protein